MSVHVCVNCYSWSVHTDRCRSGDRGCILAVPVLECRCDDPDVVDVGHAQTIVVERASSFLGVVGHCVLNSRLGRIIESLSFIISSNSRTTSHSLRSTSLLLESTRLCMRWRRNTSSLMRMTGHGGQPW